MTLKKNTPLKQRFWVWVCSRTLLKHYKHQYISTVLRKPSFVSKIFLFLEKTTPKMELKDQYFWLQEVWHFLIYSIPPSFNQKFVRGKTKPNFYRKKKKKILRNITLKKTKFMKACNKVTTLKVIILDNAIYVITFLKGKIQEN